MYLIIYIVIGLLWTIYKMFQKMGTTSESNITYDIFLFFCNFIFWPISIYIQLRSKFTSI